MKINTILERHWPANDPTIDGVDTILDGDTWMTLGWYDFKDGLLTIYSDEGETVGRYRMKGKPS